MINCVLLLVLLSSQTSGWTFQTSTRTLKHDTSQSLPTRCYNRKDFLTQSSVGLIISMLPQVAKAEETPQNLTNADKDSSTVRQLEDTLQKEEKDFISGLSVEETDETKALQDTKQLIAEIEDTIQEENVTPENSTSTVTARSSTTDLLERLEQEEEKIENETKDLITKIEVMEAQAESIGEALLPDETNEQSKLETQSFLDKLKERVNDQEDFIARLKSKSAEDIDPKTGKFRTMTAKEFRAKMPTDFDFVDYLKKSFTQNEEFERDLEAFQGLLENKLGIQIKQ